MRKQNIFRGLAAFALLALFGCSHSSTPSSGTSNSSSNTSSSSPSSSTDNSASNSNSAAPPAPAPPPPIVVPAGKILVVTIDQDISTKTNSSGDAFAASLAEPVTVDGQTVIPSGTRVTGTVVQSQAAGHVKGGAILELTLDAIRLNGQKFSIDTTEFEEAGKGRGKRTAIGGGGGAAFGAIVGALAGGGKGAAIGALAGGGAGTAGAAYTGKRDITIPAETRLHFKLKHSISIPQR
ncbi:MAG TPA: hypothetical protein VMB02_00605 [Candidatus Aquilonibacter sp.]|nr:hypothetical protein [Candidatus Aquilonibacter sp.]